MGACSSQTAVQSSDGAVDAGNVCCTPSNRVKKRVLTKLRTFNGKILERGPELVGQKLQVQWGRSWYKGEIVQYKRDDAYKWQIHYEDGDMEFGTFSDDYKFHNTAKAKRPVEWLSCTPMLMEAIKRHMEAADVLTENSKTSIVALISNVTGKEIDRDNLVGNDVKIFWNNHKWYQARIEDYKPSKPHFKWFLHYEDQDTEWGDWSEDYKLFNSERGPARLVEWLTAKHKIEESPQDVSHPAVASSPPHIGNDVRIFWNNHSWYQARIEDYQPSKSRFKWFLHYEDNDTEWGDWSEDYKLFNSERGPARTVEWPTAKHKTNDGPPDASHSAVAATPTHISNSLVAASTPNVGNSAAAVLAPSVSNSVAAMLAPSVSNPVAATTAPSISNSAAPTSLPDASNSVLGSSLPQVAQMIAPVAKAVVSAVPMIGPALGACIQLANEIIVAAERVKLNHERCKRINERVKTMLPTLQMMQEQLARPNNKLAGLEQHLINLNLTYTDCKVAVELWVDKPGSSMLGALRRMLRSQDFEMTFRDLQERLTQCWGDLCSTLQVIQAVGPLPITAQDQPPTAEQLQKDGEADVHAMAQLMMEHSWDELTADEQKTAITYYADMGLDLQRLRKQERSRLRTEILKDLLIPQKEIRMQQEPVGAGGSGSVYKAMYHGTEVAVKVLHEGSVLPEKLRAQLENEAWIMSRLHHRNIVKLEGVIVEHPCYALVMQYYAQGSVMDRLHSLEPPALPERLGYAVDTARAVHYLHSKRKPIVHGDLKTSNLLLDDNNRVIVTDFGVSRIAAAITTMTMTAPQRSSAVSLVYTAPELLGVAEVVRTTESDIFALGMLLYEIFSLKTPYQSCRPDDARHNIKNGVRPSLAPEGLHPLLVNLISSCWAQNPSDRPSSGHVLDQLELIQQEAADGAAQS